jgi:hypothetical protein
MRELVRVLIVTLEHSVMWEMLRLTRIGLRMVVWLVPVWVEGG